MFILVDDLAYGHLGCYGNKVIQTPNIDRMAAEGMRFTSFYAGSSVCAPSRCCLMTGLHTGHARVRGNTGINNWRISLEPEDLTVAEVLKDQGYATGMFGKWGIGEDTTEGIPTKQGFDEFYGYLNQKHAHDHYTEFLYENEKQIKLPGNEGGKRQTYTQDLFTAKALDFIRGHKDEPFFLYVPYVVPHAELIAPTDAPYSDKPWPDKVKMLAAMITRMDGDVGKIPALLKELKLDENTIVMFASDNGAPGLKGSEEFIGSAGPFKGRKGGVYEGSLRVPLIARWPGRIKAGVVNDQPWAFWDFLPTAAELAGAKAPPKLDGLSFVPALVGREGPAHEFFYWEYHDGVNYRQAVRLGQWKGVRQGPKEPIELYDLSKDPDENKNIAADNAQAVARIDAIMTREHTDSEDYPAVKVPPTTPVPATTKPAKR